MVIHLDVKDAGGQVSPNPNYIAGRAFEYERMAHYKSLGYEVMRTAGSHGLFDIIAISPLGSVEFIQCKRVSTKAEAELLIKKFKENPPIEIKYTTQFHQVLEVKIKGSTKVISTIL